MAVTFSKGTFTRPNGTGTQTIDTGTGVTGKALILFATRQTATGFDESNGHKVLFYGFATSPSQRGCVCISVQAGVSTTNGGKGYFTDRIVEVFSDSTPTEESVADFVDFTTGGAGRFTINWTINPGGASAIIIHYVFIGGSDISNAFVGGFTGPGAGVTGSKSFIGVGFAGKFAMFLNSNQTATGTATGMSFGIGAAESSTKRWASGFAMNDNQASGLEREAYQSRTLCLVTEKHGSVAGDMASDNKADLTSYDSDGFTLNYTKVTTGSVLFLALILGGTFAVNVSNFRILGHEMGSPTQTVSFGFKPSGVLSHVGAWVANELDLEDVNDVGICVGAASPTAQGIVGLDVDNPGASHETASAMETETSVVASQVDADQPPGTGGRELILSYETTNDDGFTVKTNATTFAVKQQIFIFYVALGDSGQPTMPRLRGKWINWITRDNTSAEPAGKQVVTGVGFAPLAVIVMRAAPNDAWFGSPRAAMGFATRRGGTVQQGMVSYETDGNVSTTAASRMTRNDAMCAFGGGTRLVTLDTLDADGFTFAYSATDKDERIQFLVLGGSDLVDANVLLPTMATAGPTQAITGAGFAPTAALFLYANTAHVTSQQANGKFSFGAASSATDEWCVAICANDGITTTGAMNWQKVVRNDACMYNFLTDGTQDAKWDLAAFDSNGLTLNVVDAPATASTIAVILCLKGGKFKAGTKAKATGGAPVDDAFPGIGFIANGVLMANTHQTSANTIEVHENFSLGCATSKDGSQEGSVVIVGADATLPTQENWRLSSNKAAVTAVHGASPAIQAEADMKSFTSDTFTLTWTTNVATADIIVYLAFGSILNPVLYEWYGNGYAG